MSDAAQLLAEALKSLERLAAELRDHAHERLQPIESEGAAADPLMTGEVPPLTITGEQKEQLENRILAIKDDLRRIQQSSAAGMFDTATLAPPLDALQKSLTDLLGLL